MYGSIEMVLIRNDREAYAGLKFIKVVGLTILYFLLDIVRQTEFPKCMIRQTPPKITSSNEEFIISPGGPSLPCGLPRCKAYFAPLSVQFRVEKSF